MSTTETLIDQVHHLGITVADMDRSLGFWWRFLGVEPTSRRLIDAQFLGDLVGYAGAILEIAWVDLPGGLSLELVRYDRPVEAPLAVGSAHPGAVHICFGVHDLTTALQLALDAGATLASLQPVVIPAGPNLGARHAYVRDPDGISIELRQAPPA